VKVLSLGADNRFKRAVIDDLTSSNIDASQQDYLLDLFESAMKSISHQHMLDRGLLDSHLPKGSHRYVFANTQGGLVPVAS
jgi:hypothetical protein